MYNLLLKNEMLHSCLIANKIEHAPVSCFLFVWQQRHENGKELVVQLNMHSVDLCQERWRWFECTVHPYFLCSAQSKHKADDQKAVTIKPSLDNNLSCQKLDSAKRGITLDPELPFDFDDLPTDFSFRLAIFCIDLCLSWFTLNSLCRSIRGCNLCSLFFLAFFWWAEPLRWRLKSPSELPTSLACLSKFSWCPFSLVLLKPSWFN